MTNTNTSLDPALVKLAAVDSLARKVESAFHVFHMTPSPAAAERLRAAIDAWEEAWQRATPKV